MKRILLAAAMFGLAIVTSASAASQYVNGEMIVKFKNGIRRDRETMNAFYNSIGAEKVYRFTGALNGYEKISIAQNLSVRDAIRKVMLDSNVEFAQPNFILRIQPVTMESSAPSRPRGPLDGGLWPTKPGPNPPTPPNRPPLEPAPAEVNPPVEDPKLADLYGMEKIGATDSWEKSTGKTILVADIDTGADYNHEDLSFNMWRNPNPTNGDVVGFDFVHGDGIPYDDNMHGSHTAGTIGGVGGNGKGVIGVAPRVSLMAVKFLSAEGSGTTADAVKAIDYAVEHGAKILSNSWGGGADPDNQILYDSIERAKAKDVLFIAAAGNSSQDNDGKNASYPAAFNNENMIAVAATDRNDQLAQFSNYGKKSVHLAAPGVKIVSTTPSNTYKALSGTSMACPHVAGAAAMVWAKHTNWTFKDVKAALMNTVDKLPGLTDVTVTGGRLNLRRALEQ